MLVQQFLVRDLQRRQFLQVRRHAIRQPVRAADGGHRLLEERELDVRARRSVGSGAAAKWRRRYYSFPCPGWLALLDTFDGLNNQ